MKPVKALVFQGEEGALCCAVMTEWELAFRQINLKDSEYVINDYKTTMNIYHLDKSASQCPTCMLLRPRSSSLEGGCKPQKECLISCTYSLCLLSFLLQIV
jgi:hypothetical protein